MQNCITFSNTKGVVKPESIDIISCYFSEMFFINTHKNIDLFYEKSIFNISLIFRLKDNLPSDIKYVEWYIKYDELGITKLKEIIYVDESFISINYNDGMLPFTINKFFCKKNGLHIRCEENYLIVPIMVESLCDLFCIDIYLKPLTPYQLRYKSFWETSFIKIPNIKSQNRLPYFLNTDFKNKNTKYVVIFCGEYYNSNCPEFLRNLWQSENLYKLLDEWREYNVNIKIKPKLSYVLVIFSDFSNTDSKKFISRLLDIDKISHVFELCSIVKS